MCKLQPTDDKLSLIGAWSGRVTHYKIFGLQSSGAVLGIFIWVGQSKAKQILGRPTEVVYVGIMGMTRAIWVGQKRVWVGHGLIARTASANHIAGTAEPKVRFCTRVGYINSSNRMTYHQQKGVVMVT